MDTDAALRVDAAMEVSQRTESVTVNESETAIETQVEAVATLGEVVSDKEMEALPRNGFSYTDFARITLELAKNFG